MIRERGYDLTSTRASKMAESEGNYDLTEDQHSKLVQYQVYIMIH